MAIKLGHKSEPPELSPRKDNKLYYPNMYINETKLPMEPGDVGKTFEATVKLKVTGVNQNHNMSGSNFNYDFEVHEIEFVEMKGKK